MNALQQLLQGDLDRLVDRLAASARPGMLGECAEHRPELLTRLEHAEAELSDARRDLLEAYDTWREALDHCEDLWAATGLETVPMPEVAARAA